MCSIPLLPSMLGGVTPVSVIREILCEAGVDTLPELWCSVAAPCTWTLRTPVENLVDTDEEPVFAFYLDNQVDGELAFGGVNSAHCTEILVYITWRAPATGKQLGRPEAL